MPLTTLVTRTQRAVQLWARIHTMSVCIYVVWMNRVPRHAYPCQNPKGLAARGALPVFFYRKQTAVCVGGEGEEGAKGPHRQTDSRLLSRSLLCVCFRHGRDRCRFATVRQSGGLLTFNSA